MLVALLFGVVPAAALDLYADNDDGAPVYVETGTWEVSSNPGFNEGTYHRTWDTYEYSTATWTPNLPEDGYYEVYSIFRRYTTRTTSAPYRIDHASGSSHVTVDMTGDHVLDEEYLGTYFFHAGTAGRVILSNDGAPGGYIADAIRFHPLPPPKIEGTSNYPVYPAGGEPSTALARVTSDGAIASVMLHWAASGGSSGAAAAYDDGTHQDRLTGDNFYGAPLPPGSTGTQVDFYFVATDDRGLSTTGALVSYEVGKVAQVDLVLNELLASNAQTNIDPDFEESGDWVEIYNLGPDRADLSQYAIADEPDDASEWAFPVGASLGPDEYLVLWCDDEDTSAIAHHANFKLSQAGESVVLVHRPTSQVVDQVDFGEQVTDSALARLPNLTGTWTRTDQPTPGAANVLVLRGAEPIFSLSSGVYPAGTHVSISAPGASAIRYTTDGSEPDVSSSVYLSPIRIDAYTGLRARAYYDDLDPSRVATVCYFTDSMPARTMPVMNLMMDPDDLFGPDGIYTNWEGHGFEWERKAHVLIMHPDGSSVHETNAGIRLNGAYYRRVAKKSFKLYFRSLYGQSQWSLPWIQQDAPAEEFRHLVLRGGGCDGFLTVVEGQLREVTYVRDQLTRDWYADVDQRSPDGFFTALYLNGEYWGLYNITERLTDDFMEETFGGEDWDVIKADWRYPNPVVTEAVDGDLTEWNALLDWMGAHDVSTDADFASLKEKIDYDNFMEYMALNIFLQNIDWPQNNFVASKRREDPTARWIFHEWDAEWVLGLEPQGYQNDTIRWAQGDNTYVQVNGTVSPISLLFNGNDFDPNRTQEISGILDHPEGRGDFVRIMEKRMNFEFRTGKTLADFNQMVDGIDAELLREVDRWAADSLWTASQLLSNLPSAMNDARTFLTNRPEFMRNLVVNKFSLGGKQTLSITAAGGGSGRVLVYGDHWVSPPWTGVFFAGSEVSLEAVPEQGSAFASWSGDISSSVPGTTFIGGTGGSLSAVVTFNTAAASAAPNDVIFNEYWVNDDETPYESLSGRGVDGDWIELLVVTSDTDLRGWRVTNNPSKTKMGTATDGEGDGSLIFPDHAALGALCQGTIILLITNENAANDAAFPADDLDGGDRRLLFYVGNGNLNVTTDPDFGVRRSDEALVLLAPGATDSFADDVGVDFIGEGAVVTPSSFGVAGDGVVFNPSFEGIGADDGAVFTNDASEGFNNDDASDPSRDDDQPGQGGWIVDPPSQFTGEGPLDANILTPGAPNTGQVLDSLVPCGLLSGWQSY